MRVALVVVVGVLSMSTAFADAKRDRQVESVQAAIAKGELERLANPPILVDGLHFADATCEAHYGRKRSVDEAELAELSECLKGEKLAVAGDTLVAEPGVEIEVDIRGGKVSALLSDGVVRAPHAAEHLAATGSIAPSAAVKAAMAKSKVPVLAVDIALCVGPDGAVTSATLDRYTRVAGTWGDEILATTQATKYAPFTRHGTALAVCTHQLHVYPAAKRKAGLAELARVAGYEGRRLAM